MLRTAYNAAILQFYQAKQDVLESPLAHKLRFGFQDKSNVTIVQVSDNSFFTNLPNDTYADPNPVKRNNMEMFKLAGIWNQANVDLHHVNFSCNLAGADVYTKDFDCTGGDNEHCPQLNGTIGEMWHAEFGFDVPLIAPPFVDYNVHVTAYDSKGGMLFQL